jgi:hypothetical protein
MASHEVFIYGGQNFVPFVELAMRVGNGVRYGPLTQLGEGSKNANQAQIVAVLRVLAKHVDLIRIPDLLIGFRLSEPTRAVAQFKRLTDLIESQAGSEPMLKKHVKINKDEKKTTITLTLPGELIPWDKIPLQDYESSPGEFDAVVKKIREMKLIVTLTNREDYVLASIGESNGALARLGTDKPLADAPEIKQLAEHADRKTLGLSYASREFISRVAATGEDFSFLGEALKAMAKRGELTEEQQKKLRSDLDGLQQELKQVLPRPGAQASITLAGDKGLESYSYKWTDGAKAAASRPLTLLDHVGGSPLVAVVGNIGRLGEKYKFLAKWSKVAYADFEDIVLPKWDDEKKEKFEEWRKTLLPTLKRFDQTTQTVLLPALEGGQWAFVLDAKIKSKQWHAFLPAREKALPLLELALVLGLQDTEPLQRAFTDYRKTLNELIAKVHDVYSNLPEFEIPEPNNKSSKLGTIYYYPIPEQLGLDPQLMPNAGLSKTVAAATLSQNHTDRLLASTPLAAGGSKIIDSGKPLLSAAYCDWAGLMTALAPWGEFLTETILDRQGIEGDDPADPHSRSGILKQVRDGLDILKALKHFASATYLQEDKVVTHTELAVEDIP